MKSVARFFFHLVRNTLFKNYRYFRLSINEKGLILFYDRARRNFFRVRSRGFIDSVTANQIYSNDEYNFAWVGRDAQVRAAYQTALDAGKLPIIIDCGANIGLSCQYFAREFPKAQILAIEPDIENFKLAQENCVGLDNIRFFNAAIGSQAGFAAIDDASVDPNAFRVSRVGEGEGIEIKTIPDLVAGIDNADVFIVKVDIEGFERDLFKDNTEWIQRCRVLVVELHDWMLPNEASSGNFLRAIGSYDRDFLFKGESVFSFKNE